MSPVRYFVKSDTLACTSVECSFTTTAQSRDIGQACPRCELGRLEFRRHVVDVAAHGGLGECDCERYQFNIAGKVHRLTTETVAAEHRYAYRCKHIDCARLEAMTPENLDAMLAAFVPQEQTC